MENVRVTFLTSNYSRVIGLHDLREPQVELPSSVGKPVECSRVFNRLRELALPATGSLPAEKVKQFRDEGREIPDFRSAHILPIMLGDFKSRLPSYCNKNELHQAIFLTDPLDRQTGLIGMRRLDMRSSLWFLRQNPSPRNGFWFKDMLGVWEERSIGVMYVQSNGFIVYNACVDLVVAASRFSDGWWNSECTSNVAAMIEYHPDSNLAYVPRHSNIFRELVTVNTVYHSCSKLVFDAICSNT